MFNPTNIEYTSCFCEENVYKLAEKACEAGYESAFVVFISSVSKCTPIWYQKASSSIEEPVLWDYHVILLVKHSDHNSAALQITCVYDLDTLLPFPSSFDDYFDKAFRPQTQFKAEYSQKFRVVPARQFLSNFASDRSHMVSSGKSFPTWPCIKGENADCDMNLFSFMDVNSTVKSDFGTVYSREEFRVWAGSL